MLRLQVGYAPCGPTCQHDASMVLLLRVACLFQLMCFEDLCRPAPLLFAKRDAVAMDAFC